MQRGKGGGKKVARQGLLNEAFGMRGKRLGRARKLLNAASRALAKCPGFSFLFLLLDIENSLRKMAEKAISDSEILELYSDKNFPGSFTGLFLS